MSDQRTRGRRVTRPARRLRRWARHTPTRTIAMNMVALGLALVLVAAVLWFAVL